MGILVSVIIPTYGRPDYLLRAISSVLNQSHQHVEVIVVDDNDPESEHRVNTEAVMVKMMADGRVRYIKHHENRNGSAARNSGLRAATGEFVSFLDDDDELLPNKLKKQLDLLARRPECKAVYCLNSSIFKGRVVRKTSYTEEGDCSFDILSLRSDIHTSSLLICRNCVEEIGGFDETFIRHQEFEFMIRYFEHFTMCCLPEVLLHVHIDSSMNRPDVDRLIAAKSHYFSKMERFVEKFTQEQKSEIFKAHNLHLFRTCLKNLDSRAIKYLYLSRPNWQDVPEYLIPFVDKYFKMAVASTKKLFIS